MLEISVNTYTEIKDLEQVKLWVHEVVREDAHLLFGFYTEAEREMFRLLINVNGVGVATARVMLSSLTVSELATAIADQNAKQVQKVKGIGAKTAQRILLELKDKLKGALFADVQGGVTGQVAVSQAAEEALTALVILGFAKAAAEKTVALVCDGQPDLTVEEIVKQAMERGI